VVTTGPVAAVVVARLTDLILALVVLAQEGSVVSSATRYALLNSENAIVSIALWDGVSDWNPPDGLRAVPESDLDDISVFPAPQPVPAVITCVQGRLALLQTGMLDAVEASISEASREVRIFWEFAVEWHRTNAVLISLGQSLGLTDSQVDDLFRLAKRL